MTFTIKIPAFLINYEIYSLRNILALNLSKMIKKLMYLKGFKTEIKLHEFGRNLEEKTSNMFTRQNILYTEVKLKEIRLYKIKKPVLDFHVYYLKNTYVLKSNYIVSKCI